MLRTAVEIGKYNNPNDETIENYHALVAAILGKEFNISEHYSYLYNKDAAKKRVKEIDELRAKGQKTELQIWWEEQIEKDMKKSRIKKIREKTSFNKVIYKFKDELVDCWNLSVDEISLHKLKVINIETGVINLYDTREEVSKAIGIDTTNITNPYMRRQLAYKGKYLITIEK